MKKNTLLICAVAVISFLSGCATTGGLQGLDADWGRENQGLQDKLGVKTYENISKEKAMNALMVAFQRLDLIVENSDFKTGFMMATANSPKPLTYDEYEIVKKAENDKAVGYEPRFSWDFFRDFKSQFNAVFLETGNGVQISIRANLNFVGDRTSVIPITEFPSEGLKISLPKIWNEFEKVAFIQEKTLNK